MRSFFFCPSFFFFFVVFAALSYKYWYRIPFKAHIHVSSLPESPIVFGTATVHVSSSHPTTASHQGMMGVRPQKRGRLAFPIKDIGDDVEQPVQHSDGRWRVQNFSSGAYSLCVDLLTSHLVGV